MNRLTAYVSDQTASQVQALMRELDKTVSEVAEAAIGLLHYAHEVDQAGGRLVAVYDD